MKVCPRCLGKGKRLAIKAYDTSSATTKRMITCEDCGGTGRISEVAETESTHD